jgi:hypothetical protein
MRSSITVPAALLALALSATPAVQADDRYQGRRDSIRYDSRRVEALARDIQQTAYTIHLEARRNNRRPDRDEGRMLSALSQLYREAEQFHDRVDGRGRDERGAVRHFENLVQEFWQTGDALDRVAPRPYIDRGMDRIGSSLAELSRYYGLDNRYDRRGRNGRGYDRYERDRDDRDGRYGRDRRGDHDRWDGRN